MDWNEKARLFCSSVIGQFVSRTEVEGRKQGIDFGVSLEVTQEKGACWFTFTKDDETHSFSVPLVFVENNVLLLEQNEVRRAVCPYFIREDDMILDYYSVMQRIITDTPTGLVSPALLKKSPFIQQVVWSFSNGNTSVIMYNLQRAINEVVNRMPLHDTALNSYIMNHRLIIIDPAFNAIRSPEDRLDYQIEKSKAYFARGWTPIGLADGNLADKNYTLMCDIRHLTPFGMKYHNPQRNLYSTLGMKGDELPNIRSQSMQNLMDSGITRKGWNMFTLFADIPDCFEDQIMVDKRHANKFITYEKRYQCYGLVKVKKGQKVKTGQTLSISDKGMAKKFDVDCDNAKVLRISPSLVNVGGVKTEVFNVVISYRRYLRDGVKFTNLHGNKGVIRMKDLGRAVDPSGKGLRQIDVIVSAKSIKKRENYGQIMEALLNNTSPGINQDNPMVLDDYYEVPEGMMEKALSGNGLPSDGTWHCETYVGPVDGVCGDVFWGVIASVENSLWGEGATVRKNTRDLRTAGLKFSHVEMRALQTRFGKDNPILGEILTYAQGSDDLHESFKILQSKKGILPEGTPRRHTFDVKFVNQSSGTIVDEEYLTDTVVDEHFEPDGFTMQLPVAYQVWRDASGEVVYEGAPVQKIPDDIKEVYTFDTIYIPKASMRRCWKHDNGKFGLNEIGVLINNILVMAYRYAGEPTETRHISMLYRSIASYFSRIADMMGTKKGDISKLGMSVRYPFSSKAVATLSNRLPENTVEIHESMAKQLRISNGDVVLVERFPCLGFMSVRPQKVRITQDEMARYTIRASSNCLCSLGLDFDGDVMYLASFHTPEARELLHAEWEYPNSECYSIICRLNDSIGTPGGRDFSLADYNISAFEALTAETHATMVSNITGVKSHTGPVIALAYNLMRILENSNVCDLQDTNVAIEYFLDTVGNTVFAQKHGTKSLHAIVTEAICCGHVEALAKEGFDRATSQTIVDVITEKARALGVNNLEQYYKKAKENGWSNIINRIVRQQNKIYYASRANLEACVLLDHLEAPAVDIPSRILKDILSGKVGALRTKLEECLDQDALDGIRNTDHKDACRTLMDMVEDLLSPSKEDFIDKEMQSNMMDCLRKQVRRVVCHRQSN